MIAWLREGWWIILAVVLGGLMITAMIRTAIERGETEQQEKKELLQGHCVATDMDGRALIYTCDGGKHVVRY